MEGRGGRKGRAESPEVEWVCFGAQSTDTEGLGERWGRSPKHRDRSGMECWAPQGFLKCLCLGSAGLGSQWPGYEDIEVLGRCPVRVEGSLERGWVGRQWRGVGHMRGHARSVLWPRGRGHRRPRALRPHVAESVCPHRPWAESEVEKNEESCQSDQLGDCGSLGS